ncbi:hypothetical protein [Marinobacter sp. SS13-12]|uniref:anti-sigma factor family protein n=1 Tax=Marinobacter sp. SS13-12 TaxID=3050451 RepID=UPI0025535FFE|nr:hypothetical protein [Marinobacter sp. SS13-12]MDK8462510.1 hypothetical protein [Marinobacter sp. SS13-12]
MNITDETLSAFLDNELAEAEMEAVRDQLEADPSLADRLAGLAAVDAELQSHYGSIDDRPMPESVTRMLAAETSDDADPAQDNVVTFPWWRRMRGHTGKAVAAAVIAGVALTQWLTLPSNGETAWPAVVSVLDSQPSGEVYQLDNHASLTPRLTFRSQAGEWCRQFRLETDDVASEQIACRSEGGAWEQAARVEARPSPEPESYQTASGGSVLDETLDQMMDGSPIGPDAERALLQHRWGDR